MGHFESFPLGLLSLYIEFYSQVILKVKKNYSWDKRSHLLVNKKKTVLIGLKHRGKITLAMEATILKHKKALLIGKLKYDTLQTKIFVPY